MVHFGVVALGEFFKAAADDFCREWVHFVSGAGTEMNNLAFANIDTIMPVQSSKALDDVAFLKCCLFHIVFFSTKGLKVSYPEFFELLLPTMSIVT